MIIQSRLMKEWIEEALKEELTEELEKVAISKTRESIIDLLTEKFDFVPRTMQEQLAKVNDQVVLHSLLRKIIRVEGLEDFGASLEKVVR